jgi:hypothetical protein
MSEFELAQARNNQPPQGATAQRQGRKRKDRNQAAAPEPTAEEIERAAEEKALADMVGPNHELSKKIPLRDEIVRFVALVQQHISHCLANNIPIMDPLHFYCEKQYGPGIPILTRLASTVETGAGAEGDCERIFSEGGIVCSDLRNRLKAETVEDLIFLHGVYSENCPLTSRAKRTIADFDSFILNTVRDIVNKNDGDEHLDKLSAWFYESDEESDAESDNFEDEEGVEDEDAVI